MFRATYDQWCDIFLIGSLEVENISEARLLRLSFFLSFFFLFSFSVMKIYNLHSDFGILIKDNFKIVFPNFNCQREVVLRRNNSFRLPLINANQREATYEKAEPRRIEPLCFIQYLRQLLIRFSFSISYFQTRFSSAPYVFHTQYTFWLWDISCPFCRFSHLVCRARRLIGKRGFVWFVSMIAVIKKNLHRQQKESDSDKKKVPWKLEMVGNNWLEELLIN